MLKTRRILINGSLIIYLGIAAAACNTPVTATCTSPQNITSVDFGPSRVGNTSIGILNTHHFAPGNVIELIPPVAGAQLGSGSMIDTLTYNASTDFELDDPPTTVSQVIGTDFELTLDAKLRQYEDAIKAALKSNTQLVVTDGSRHALMHPLDVISAPANRSLVSHILQHPERAYIVVTGVVNAKEISLQYGSSNNASNTLTIPGTNVTINVTYNCSNVADLKSAGDSKSGLAFYYTTVGAVNNKVDTVPTADLTKYQLANAIR